MRNGEKNCFWRQSERKNARSYLVVRKLVRREEPRDEDFEEVKDVRKERGQSSDD